MTDEKNAKSEFWDAMEDISGGMLGMKDGALIPMNPQVRDDAKDGKVYFITAVGNALYEADAIEPAEARFVVADRSEGIWADIEGTLIAEVNEELVDEFLGPFASAWFEEGREDPDVRLLSFTPRTAEATLTDDNSVKFFYEMAKANLTGKTPKLGGWKGKITF